MARKQDELQFFERIKTIAVIAIFSDDRLMEELVLKGGGALDIVYRASSRASIDLDFSMGEEFESIESLTDRLSKCMTQLFREQGLVVFDFAVSERPPGITDDLRDFWGGYLVEFKIATPENFAAHSASIESLRRHALVLPNNSTKFTIDISKHEYREEKVASDLDGYTIYVYTPDMIVSEKLRAICQQMPAYGPIVKRQRAGSGRARDFLDIFVACDLLDVDFTRPHFHEVVRRTFAAKRVPLALIGEIHQQREFHRPDFVSVQATVKPGFALKSFDEYFDFVVDKCHALEVLWKMESPA
jgi:predicted nucleotidyltransferase component of viral defense system